MSTVALQGVWEYLCGLSLSADNKRWLADKLIKSESKSCDMPCSFSDEEWKEEVRLSEEEGVATDEEAEEFFKAWKVAE